MGLEHLPKGRCGTAKLVDMRTPLRKKAQLKDVRDGAGWRLSCVWQHGKRDEMSLCEEQMRGAVNREGKLKRGKISIEK